MISRDSAVYADEPGGRRKTWLDSIYECSDTKEKPNWLTFCKADGQRYFRHIFAYDLQPYTLSRNLHQLGQSSSGTKSWAQEKDNIWKTTAMTGAPDGKTVKPEEPGTGGGLLIISDDYDVQIKKDSSKMITMNLVLANQESTASDTSFRKTSTYESKSFNQGAELYDFGSRSVTGRCTTPDDILAVKDLTRTGGLNRLAFGNNDSMIHTDHPGHLSLSAALGAVLDATSVFGAIAITVAIGRSAAAGTGPVKQALAQHTLFMIAMN
ncbi:virulence plasmid b [Fusarium denticulatum]|uniref:Virulence plasmid b n=1 Tax=Fusarium denticulatum TaxID=48507 RepID=A0A8H5XF89_9HYPO|nr:virulence plasmid b [Fusarium denticulatum]